MSINLQATSPLTGMTSTYWPATITGQVIATAVPGEITAGDMRVAVIDASSKGWMLPTVVNTGQVKQFTMTFSNTGTAGISGYAQKTC